MASGVSKVGQPSHLDSRLTNTCFLCCVHCVQLHLFLPIFESDANVTSSVKSLELSLSQKAFFSRNMHQMACQVWSVAVILYQAVQYVPIAILDVSYTKYFCT